MIKPTYSEYEDEINQITQFVADLRENIYIQNDKEDKEETYEELSRADINKHYRSIKENKFTKSIVVMCSNLKRHEANFSKPESMKENFVLQEPGLTFYMFEFSTLDFKAIWNNDKTTSAIKKYIMVVFAQLYKHSHAIYRCITSADVDIDTFAVLLIGAIKDMRKQPELHRCTNAFNRIEGSVHLLKERFDNYYRESIAAANPDLLVMNFIVDVSNEGGATASLTREFRTIIAYMHKSSQRNGKNKDANVQKIFKMLNSNFELMEKHTRSKTSNSDESKVDLKVKYASKQGALKGLGMGEKEAEIAKAHANGEVVPDLIDMRIETSNEDDCYDCEDDCDNCEDKEEDNDDCEGEDDSDAYSEDSENAIEGVSEPGTPEEKGAKIIEKQRAKRQKKTTKRSVADE
jgi:hypothetical protein